MRRALGLALLAAACGTSRAPADSGPPRFTWPVPAGWRGETIPFPLEFAPEIRRRGVEELRFAPGFFQPEAPGYWTYAFAWVVTDGGAVDPATLARELTTYFRGLTRAVAAERKDLPPLDPGQIQVRLDPGGRGAGRTFDAFGDGRAIDLELAVTVAPCGSGRAILVAAARRGHPPIDPPLEDVVRSFRCDPPVRN